MTLAATPIVNSYVGTGGANSYSFNFPVFSAGDITVVVISPTGVKSTLSLGIDYVVAGLYPIGGPATTGSITLVNSSQAWLTGGNLTSGWTIAITRIVSLAQSTTFRNQGDFYQETIESALDYLMMAIQQLQQTLTAPVVPASITVVTGDINITAAGAGLIVTTPNGQRTYRIAVDNNGAITSQRIT